VGDRLPRMNRCSFKRCRSTTLYRALSLDYSKYSSDGKENGMDAIVPGPLMGVSMKF
jgi:hypothetical protein